MQRKFRSPSSRRNLDQRGFSNVHIVVGLLVGMTGLSLAVLAAKPFAGNAGPSRISHGTLTFEQRVFYQRAIEEIYWRHRNWPKERANPKPSLDAVMSQVQLENKVRDYLGDSQTLK